MLFYFKIYIFILLLFTASYFISKPYKIKSYFIYSYQLMIKYFLGDLLKYVFIV